MNIEEQLDGLFVIAFMANPCPMAITENSRYLLVNDAFLNALGYSKIEVTGKTSNELSIFSNRNDYDNAIQLMQERGCLRNFEANIRCKNGSEIIGSFNAEYIKIEGKTFLLTVMNDVTSMKLLEKEVIRLANLI